MKTTIAVKLQVEGLHRWLGANDAEYSYLKSLHRHMFHIEATKKVTHSDRDIEIIQFSHYIQDFLDEYYDDVYRLRNFGDLSCEMIAQMLLANFGLESCKVAEDGEHGAMVEMADSENLAICGPCNSGKSALAERWYGDGWNVIEVGQVVKKLLDGEGQNLFDKNKRVLRPDLDKTIAYAIKLRLNHKRNLIVGVRQPQILEELNLTNIIMLDRQYGSYDAEGAAIDEKLGLHDIKPTIFLPWTIV